MPIKYAQNTLKYFISQIFKDLYHFRRLYHPIEQPRNYI